MSPGMLLAFLTSTPYVGSRLRTATLPEILARKEERLWQAGSSSSDIPSRLWLDHLADDGERRTGAQVSLCGVWQPGSLRPAVCPQSASWRPLPPTRPPYPQVRNRPIAHPISRRTGAQGNPERALNL